jgi:IclR family pca regulon transcriptional regulator
MPATEKPPKDSEYLSTLERGLRVLRAFDAQHPEMQLSEVAQLTQLNPAVARRCLNTLVQLGYVAQYGRKFLLRAEVLTFGTSYLSSMNVEQVVLPPLQQVRDDTGDSTSMAVLSNDHILYVAHVSTNRRIRLARVPGRGRRRSLFRPGGIDAVHRENRDDARRVGSAAPRGARKWL